MSRGFPDAAPTLTAGDVALKETIRLMEEIDAAIKAHGG
jgi:hypothetical protein